jgi:hypothetical protein
MMRGNRLRLVSSSPNSISPQQKLQFRRRVAEETAKDTRTAHIQIYHDAADASIIQQSLR